MPDHTTDTTRTDPARVVAEIKAEVARRRAAGEYPQQLIDRLEAEFTVVEEEPRLETLAHLDTVGPLRSSRPLAGRAVDLTKRAIRRSIGWYVRPVTENQTSFNFGVVRRLYDLEARLARLENGRVGESRETAAHGAQGSGLTPPSLAEPGSTSIAESITPAPGGE